MSGQAAAAGVALAGRGPHEKCAGDFALPPGSLEAMQAARLLAQAGWDEPDLRLLGRKIRPLLKTTPAEFAAEAGKQGPIPLHLLILSASTASHLTDALIATAVRSGFLLEVTVAV